MVLNWEKRALSRPISDPVGTHHGIQSRRRVAF